MRPRRVNRVGGINVKDHFSLSNPSSTVAFADNETLVFVDNFEQVSLQKEKNSGISEPKPIYCWTVLCIAIILFYIFPAIALFNAGNDRVGSVFLVTGIVSVVRNVFNAPSILRELGSLEGIEVNNVEKDCLSEWREKHRLGKIIGNISVGPTSNFWIRVFLFFVFVFCAIFLSAIALGVDEGATDKVIFAPKEEFYYEGSTALDYSSCAMGHNIKTPDENVETSMLTLLFFQLLLILMTKQLKCTR